MSALEERQRDCRLYIDHIGDLLATHMPKMRVYLVCGFVRSVGALADCNDRSTASISLMPEKFCSR